MRQFIEETIARATTDGHVTTMWGRRRQIPEPKARNWQVRTLGERLAVNTVVQGTAADVMELAIVRVAEALRDSPVRLTLTVHDELLFEGPPEDVEGVRELIGVEMCRVWERDPPLAVDIGIGQNRMEAK